MTLRNDELASTYFVQELDGQELARLSRQHRFLTTLLGGILPEQPDQARFRRMLDVGCGPGDWLIGGHQEHPDRRSIGIDINSRALHSARAHATEEGLAEQIDFQMMDALRRLDFPDASFDVVNIRFGMGFVRTWEWLRLLAEMRRVTCPGGIIRLTEAEVLSANAGVALTQLGQLFLSAFDRSGHLFQPTSTGLTDHLAPLLQHIGCRQIRRQVLPLVLRAGTEEGQSHRENIEALLKTARPFLQKWGGASEHYEVLSQQVLRELQSNFHVTWTLHTIWGIV
jgi:ubiquinone/menaquinone biosynthesis C-methylase UbiE